MTTRVFASPYRLLFTSVSGLDFGGTENDDFDFERCAQTLFGHITQ